MVTVHVPVPVHAGDQHQRTEQRGPRRQRYRPFPYLAGPWDRVHHPPGGVQIVDEDIGAPRGAALAEDADRGVRERDRIAAVAADECHRGTVVVQCSYGPGQCGIGIGVGCGIEEFVETLSQRM
mgnify:CR=1 FL=1